MVGWREFSQALPNEGHIALAKLESMGKIGVTFEDSMEYYKPNCENSELNWAFSAGYQKMTIITQNVDGLHIKAGCKRHHVTELHGRNDRLVCMNCGTYRCRHDFHNELDVLNANWLQEQQQQQQQQQQHVVPVLSTTAAVPNQLRPDGDAFLPQQQDFHTIQVPPCTNCSSHHDDDAQPPPPLPQTSQPHPGFFKPDVVFFGDSVPKHRVHRCYAAVDASDGLLCIGSSLALHSAYRFVQRAATKGIPIAILNVGETRAEVSGLDVVKVEAPAGPTLEALVAKFEQEQHSKSSMLEHHLMYVEKE
jgi:NAD-dependent deacetylase sirtuin 4